MACNVKRSEKKGEDPLKNIPNHKTRYWWRWRKTWSSTTDTSVNQVIHLINQAINPSMDEFHDKWKTSRSINQSIDLTLILHNQSIDRWSDSINQSTSQATNDHAKQQAIKSTNHSINHSHTRWNIGRENFIQSSGLAIRKKPSRKQNFAIQKFVSFQAFQFTQPSMISPASNAISSYEEGPCFLGSAATNIQRRQSTLKSIQKHGSQSFFRHVAKRE